MSPHVSFTAQAGFESARRLDGASPALERLHGHSFLAQVRAALPQGWAEVPGSEAGQLQRALGALASRLDRRLLNDEVPEPDDVALVRWLHRHLEVPGVMQLALRSAPRQGAMLDAAGRIELWRSYAFQSAHRLPNVPPGHKCGRMHGHGFEAVLHVAQGAGAPSLAHEAIDAAWAPLHHELNYRCLNDLEGLHNPTSEVIAHWLWQRLRPELPGLASVAVHETATSGALFDGTTCRIWKQFTLDSAVRLRRAPATHALARLHGHTYTLRLHLQGALHEVLGWVVDFGDVKAKFAPLFERLDHQPLHEIEGLADASTAELAAWVLEQSQHELPELDRVDLFETAGRGAIVRRGHERAPLMP